MGLVSMDSMLGFWMVHGLMAEEFEEDLLAALMVVGLMAAEFAEDLSAALMVQT